jgi:hypothetical protein
MADIPEDRLIDAGTLLGYMRVVENDQNPFVVASAYILAASTAEETGLTEVLPRLRDGVVWKLLQYSGETKHNFRDIVKFSFGDAWSLTLHSQLMKAAWDAMIGKSLGGPDNDGGRNSGMRMRLRRDSEISEGRLAPTAVVQMVVARRHR